MSVEPRVRRMVMFKHGVAYLERGGPADGPFELSFKRDEMNDVLKSLAVWVAAGDARIGAVGFEKPEDPDEALARRNLAFPEGGALSGLVASLRGRRVTVELGPERVVGEVLGVERVEDREGRVTRTLLLRAAAGQLVTVDLARVTGLALDEAASRADLEFLVDRSRAATAGDSRTVRVALTGRAEDVRVSYVVPAPVWRVSYRLASDGDGFVLMAWGIVHNPADEDLEDIELVLTTGQPVSFQIDLYNPKLVERAVVEEESRAGAAPTRFERAPRPQAAPAPSSMRMASFGAPPPPMMAAPAPMPGRPMAAAMEVEDAAQYADRGELFEYRLSSNVSLKRGGSAMVPLFSTKLDAKKERIWRAGAGLSPDLVLRFDNTSGAVLEEGPAVIYDEGVYAGESMVPYSARKAAVRLGFAKDLALRCKADSTQAWVATGVRLGADVILEASYREERFTLVAESDHDEPVEVIFELPKIHGRSVDESKAKPFEETLGFRRYRLMTPPAGKATLEVVERWPDTRRIAYQNLDDANLEFWAGCKFLDETSLGALRSVRAAWARAGELDRQRARAEEELNGTYQKQTKLSEQLAVLKEAGQEGSLRLRYVRELGEAQDRVNALEADIKRLRGEADGARAEASQRLKEVAKG
jgi:hypothetical protein